MQHQNFCALESYVLLYQGGREVMHVPGVENQSFKLCLYKEELNKQYSHIVFYTENWFKINHKGINSKNWFRKHKF